MTWHYDLVVVCEKTGDLHPTEDIGLTLPQALRLRARNEDIRESATYKIVSCDRPASDPQAHSVDLGYDVHMAVHENRANWDDAGYCGVPNDDWFDVGGGPDRNIESAFYES